MKVNNIIEKKQQQKQSMRRKNLVVKVNPNDQNHLIYTLGLIV